MFTQDHDPRSTRVLVLETSNQAQIDDLVQRNRGLEQTNKKLADELNSEQRRVKEALTDIQKQQCREQREWRRGCEALISCHRLESLRSISDLETLKRKLLQEEEAMRQEKVQRLQRDVRILMFQIKEGELEDRMVDVEEEKEDLVAHYEEAVANLRQKLLFFATERKTKSVQLMSLEKEKDQVQDTLSQLRQDYATLQVSAESGATRLERVTLQLDGAQTKNTELERANDELRRSNTELQRQLEKWQDLDTKGNGEMEVVRKQKMELEVKMASLQDRLQKLSAEKEKELERMNKKQEKMKDIVQQWQDGANEQKSQREKAEEALADARRHIDQLKTEMKTFTASREISDEGYMTNQSVKPIRKRSRSPHQSKTTGRRSGTDDIQGIASSSRKANRRKPKEEKLSPVSEAEESGDATQQATVQRVSSEKQGKATRKSSRNDRGKAKSTPTKAVATEDDSDQGKRRRKASPNYDDDDIVEIKDKPKPTRKSRGRNNTVVTAAQDEDSETDQAPVKKKRKINIFSNPAEPTFAFMGNDFGIDIPTTLSPVKDTIGIPTRSTSASVMSRVLSKTFLKR